MSTEDDPKGSDRVRSITKLLHESTITPSTSADLFALIYDELRELASKKMRQERRDHTLQTTALLHEAYLRLVESTQVQRWENRWHFFAAAAEAMRRILVDSARQRGALKKGGGRARLDLDSLDLSEPQRSEDLIALDEALTELAKEHPEKAKLVSMRFFAGLTVQETAEALGISTTTADRHWAYARAWLYRWMIKEGVDDQPE